MSAFIAKCLTRVTDLLSAEHSCKRISWASSVSGHDSTMWLGGKQDHLLISGCGIPAHKCQPPSPPLDNIRVMVIV